MIVSDDGETVEFKTVSPFFEREERGNKGNTVRAFKDDQEELKFINMMFHLNRIKIVNPANNASFIRLITDISVFDSEIFRHPKTMSEKIYIISWDGCKSSAVDVSEHRCPNCGRE